ncbi:MAG: arginase [Lachnospiraceae bacterium]|nr:arginase [Lachnospiraceae bacterium]
MPGRLGVSESDEVIRISCKDIPGRNMYCDDEAYEEIRNRLKSYPAAETGIHFIDTGNYHYMSRIFTSFIDRKYDLYLLDNHNDMQRAGLGEILSCGSWALDVLEKDENLSSLYVYGPGSFEAEGEKCDVTLMGKTVSGRVYRGKGFESGDHPVYLSVDKDILDMEECVTNWDQGNLSMAELIELIHLCVAGKNLTGADICGGISETDPECTGDILSENTESDRKLLEEIRKYF